MHYRRAWAVDGGVLDHLEDIGVKNVEWVIFSDHHREQCQGVHHIDHNTTRVAGPHEERAFFETPLQFRKWRPTLSRPLRNGEVVDWEGFKLHIDWMPGQTEFGNCLWLELDGKRIAFTGDNLFGDPTDTEQNGHEAVVSRNSAIFEEGYLLGSRYLRDLKPDIIMGAHNVLMTKPAAFLYRSCGSRS